MSQHTATHCNTLQHTATHDNTRQHTHCNTLAPFYVPTVHQLLPTCRPAAYLRIGTLGPPSVMRRVRFVVGQTVCCSVLQCVAVCCSVLQCVAVCSVMRRVRFVVGQTQGNLIVVYIFIRYIFIDIHDVVRRSFDSRHMSLCDNLTT